MEAAGINLNTTARDEHVPEIEKYIRTVKERIRETTSTLPFEQLPHCLIVEIVSILAKLFFPQRGHTQHIKSPYHCHGIKDRLQ